MKTKAILFYVVLFLLLLLTSPTLQVCNNNGQVYGTGCRCKDGYIGNECSTQTCLSNVSLSACDNNGNSQFNRVAFKYGDDKIIAPSFTYQENVEYDMKGVNIGASFACGNPFTDEMFVYTMHGNVGVFLVNTTTWKGINISVPRSSVYESCFFKDQDTLSIKSINTNNIVNYNIRSRKRTTNWNLIPPTGIISLNFLIWPKLNIYTNQLYMIENGGDNRLVKVSLSDEVMSVHNGTGKSVGFPIERIDFSDEVLIVKDGGAIITVNITNGDSVIVAGNTTVQQEIPKNIYERNSSNIFTYPITNFGQFIINGSVIMSGSFFDALPYQPYCYKEFSLNQKTIKVVISNIYEIETPIHVSQLILNSLASFSNDKLLYFDLRSITIGLLDTNTFSIIDTFIGRGNNRLSDIPLFTPVPDIIIDFNFIYMWSLSSQHFGILIDTCMAVYDMKNRVLTKVYNQSEYGQYERSKDLFPVVSHESSNVYFTRSFTLYQFVESSLKPIRSLPFIISASFLKNQTLYFYTAITANNATKLLGKMNIESGEYEIFTSLYSSDMDVYGRAYEVYFMDDNRIITNVNDRNPTIINLKRSLSEISSLSGKQFAVTANDNVYSLKKTTYYYSNLVRNVRICSNQTLFGDFCENVINFKISDVKDGFFTVECIVEVNDLKNYRFEWFSSESSVLLSSSSIVKLESKYEQTQTSVYFTIQRSLDNTVIYDRNLTFTPKINEFDYYTNLISNNTSLSDLLSISQVVSSNILNTDEKNLLRNSIIQNLYNSNATENSKITILAKISNGTEMNDRTAQNVVDLLKSITNGLNEKESVTEGLNVVSEVLKSSLFSTAATGSGATTSTIENSQVLSNVLSVSEHVITKSIKIGDSISTDAGLVKQFVKKQLADTSLSLTTTLGIQKLLVPKEAFYGNNITSITVTSASNIYNFLNVSNISPIYRINLFNETAKIQVEKLTIPIIFEFPKPSSLQQGIKFICQYFDVKTNKLSSEGVTTIETPSTIQCETNHLTDFVFKQFYRSSGERQG